MKTILIILLTILSISAFAQTDTTFYENGTPKIVIEKFNKAELIQYFFESGKLQKTEIATIDHRLVYVEEYCENGQLLMAYNPNSEELELVTQYNCDGTKFCEYYHFRKGNRGLFKSYHSNGKIAQSGNYESKDSPIGDQKTGVWKTFSKEGKIISEITYKEGEIIDKQEY